MKAADRWLADRAQITTDDLAVLVHASFPHLTHGDVINVVLIAQAANVKTWAQARAMIDRMRQGMALPSQNQEVTP